MSHDCSFSASTVWRQLTSVWFLSHSVGWMGKMFIMRDFRQCFAQSVIFELLEVTMQFLIPDFRQCAIASMLEAIDRMRVGADQRCGSLQRSAGGTPCSWTCS